MIRSLHVPFHCAYNHLCVFVLLWVQEFIKVLVEQHSTSVSNIGSSYYYLVSVSCLISYESVCKAKFLPFLSMRNGNSSHLVVLRKAAKLPKFLWQIVPRVASSHSRLLFC